MNSIESPVCEMVENRELLSVFQAPGVALLCPVMLSGQTIASEAQSQRTRLNVMETLDSLSEDEYLTYLKAYYQAGEERFGAHWNYADLLTFLHASASQIKPRNYLEIGVRRGRSLAIVAQCSPKCSIFGFDLWMPNYAGMPNPGPDFVKEELERVGFGGRLELISGDSHQTLPEFFREFPEIKFDMINVDGDHSEDGARLDLQQVLPHLAVGGVLLLDDITHPQHQYLEAVWDDLLGNNPQFSTAKYTDLGYGVAVAVRKS
jgi:predicted O-methyltransferase YrrM